MKRIVVFIFAVLIISSTVFADVDLSSMSTDELIELRSSITEEINARTSFGGDPIGEGTFVVGKDIKSGMYYISEAKPSAVSLWVTIYESEQDFKESNEKYHILLDENGSANITLEDGMVLSLFNGSAMIQAVKPAWAL